MKHSITLFIDKAEEMIREVSDIANLSSDNISNFAHALELWLIKAEQLFKEYNHGEQALLAALRPSVILAGCAGAIDTNDAITGRRKRRKALLAEYLKQSVDFFYRPYAREKEKVNEANDIVRQVVLVALQTGLLNNVSLTLPIKAEQLVEIQNLLYTDDELSKGINRTLAIIAYPDLLRLIDLNLTNVLSGIQYSR